MVNLKKIGALSLAKLLAVLMTFVGLICGILYSVGGLIIDGLVSIGFLSSEAMSTPGLSLGTILAFGALIGMPIIFATAGFLFGLITVPLYNLYAKRFGGINIDVDV